MKIEVDTYESHKGSAKIIGIIGFVFSIFSLIFSLIPCVGGYAIAPAILSLVFCIISVVILKKQNKPIALYIAGSIIAFIALIISILQFYVFQGVYEGVNKISEEMDEVLIEKVIETIENGSDSTHVYYNEDDSLENINDSLSEEY